ncbi:sensor histidine kinase [Cohnella phaseoli]|uniref:Two-component system sensor histidine kinase YesM n=1 Tax=Cohnella phaseoli TaxID=456490 RepID=A0A3D9I274_9BACL|nr:histidine kinase [Cohnella phaseoli]RED55877.1 two-component system sensor histidine kinase YesM [Cohnella phaseoli]
MDIQKSTRKNRLTIFAKLMLTFVAVLAPLYALTLIINEKGAQSIRGEIAQSIGSRNDSYLAVLEMEVERVARMLPEYVADNDLMALSTTGSAMNDYEKIDNIRAIQRRINLIKYNSTYINEVRAYIPLLKRTILSSKFDTDVNMEEFEALQLRNVPEPELLTFWNDRLFVAMQYPTIPDRRATFVVGVEFSTDKLRRSLGGTIGIPEGHAALLNVNRNWTIASESDPGKIEQLRAYMVERMQRGVYTGYEKLAVNGIPYMVSYKYSELLSSYLVSYVPESYVTGPLDKYQYWILGVSVLSVFIVLFFSMSIYRMIHRPMKELIVSFKRMRIGEIMPMASPSRHDEFDYLYKAYNETAVHLKTLIQENYEQKIHSQRSELKRLQSQINPHFLYNCFFVLCRLIKSEDLELAYRFCLYVGDYFQFITRDDSDEVTLETEMKHVRTYVDIQIVCYGDRIQVRFDELDRDIADRYVPRLIMQPIVENVYKHAIRAMVSGGRVAIHMERRESDLFVYVEDSGDGLTDRDIELLNRRLTLSAHHIEDTTGIINVHRRIQIMYGADYGLAMSRSKLGGLKVTMRLALTEGED